MTLPRIKILSVVIIGIIAVSCGDAFEFSPNQIFDDNTEIDLNKKNIDALIASPGDDTVTIAFVGDSQRFYDELEKFIDTVNRIKEVDFVLLAGDITDFGLLEEFEQVNNRLKKISKPYIIVIGNHDVLAKGEETFKRMYGPLDFSFTYKDIKFIGHNTNGREYAEGLVPNMQWLSAEMTDAGARYIIPVSHMPPFDPDFDKTLEDDYTNLLKNNPKVLISLHGHIHEFRDGDHYNDGVRYMTSPSFDTRTFVLIKIVSGEIISTLINY